jgi:hypothetical protein
MNRYSEHFSQHQYISVSHKWIWIKILLMFSENFVNYIHAIEIGYSNRQADRSHTKTNRNITFLRNSIHQMFCQYNVSTITQSTSPAVLEMRLPWQWRWRLLSSRIKRPSSTINNYSEIFTSSLPVCLAWVPSRSTVSLSSTSAPSSTLSTRSCLLRGGTQFGTLQGIRACRDLHMTTTVGTTERQLWLPGQ